MNATALARFGSDYAAHRASEGRGYGGEELLSLPYLTSGPFAQQWTVRARSFDAFMRHVVRPMAKAANRPLSLLDLGAGNGWLSYRVALEGHQAVALDIRDDDVDGLGAAGPFLARVPGQITPVVASFDALPFEPGSFDVVVFNASLHYALDLPAVLGAAATVARAGGCLAILDSPVYRRDRDGAAMVEEKKAAATSRFGDRAETLLALPFVEYLTRTRLRDASTGLGLAWRRWRVPYPLWYELRPIKAALLRQRRPSRFDLWTSRVS
jgi:SAM-dependent methyltransferase